MSSGPAMCSRPTSTIRVCDALKKEMAHAIYDYFGRALHERET